MILSTNQLQDSRNRMLPIKDRTITKKFALSAVSIALLLFVFAASCKKIPKTVQEAGRQMAQNLQEEGKYKQLESSSQERLGNSKVEQATVKLKKTENQKPKEEEILKEEAIKIWIESIKPVVNSSLENTKEYLTRKQDLSTQSVNEIKAKDIDEEFKTIEYWLKLFSSSEIVKILKFPISNEAIAQLAQALNLPMQPFQNKTLLFLENLRSDLAQEGPSAFTKYLPKLCGILQSILDMLQTQSFDLLEKPLVTIGKNKGLEELNALFTQLTTHLNTLLKQTIEYKNSLY